MANVTRTESKLDLAVYGARGIPSTYSGYETFLTVLLPELARRGHRITIYCRRRQFADDGPYEGVTRVLLPAAPSFQLETLSHGALASLVARIRRHNVVFAVNIANVPYCFVARATGQRVVLNTDGQEWLRGKWGRAARAYWRLCARGAYRSTSALVADSNAMREVYRREFNAESTVIPYCWTGLEPAPDVASVLRPFGVEPYGYFLVAARLNPENNVAEIAKAYARSGARHPLVVLGEANYASPVYAQLEKLAYGCPGIRIGGHVADRSSFATLIGYSTAYLHGHQVGGINPSLIEAMGCGANVIALKTSFNQEALGPTGRYFLSFEVELPRLVLATEHEPTVAGDQRRQAARHRARNVYSVDAVVGAYEELFRAVAGRRAGAATSISTQWSEG